MSVDATRPTDIDPIKDWPAFIRLIAALANSNEGDLTAFADHIADITTNPHAVTLELARLGSNLLAGDLDMGGNTIANLASAIELTDAANLQDIIDYVNGIQWKEAVVAASTGDLTLDGEQTVDGVALVAGDRILVKDQADATENGIYAVAGGAWGRTGDADTGTELLAAAVSVTSGTVNVSKSFTGNATAPINIGVTEIIFVLIFGVSHASTTVRGIVELATDAETITGTDSERAVVPAGLTAALDTRLAAPGPIGGTTPDAIDGTTIDGTTITASVGFTGDLTGNADTATNADNADTLDGASYSTGTWTPELFDNSLSAAEGQTYTTQVGSWSRIGDRVTFELQIEMSSLGTLTGTDPVNITIPFASVNETSHLYAVTIGFNFFLSLTGNRFLALGQISNNQSHITLQSIDPDNGSSNNVSVAEITASGRMVLSGSYKAA